MSNSSDVAGGDDILASQYNNLRLDVLENTPSGVINLYSGTSAPTGWLICDGSGIDTTTYASLFASIGYTFGGAGATFNLPDLRDKFAIGKSGTKALGSTGGSNTINSANLPSHTHNITTGTESATHNHDPIYATVYYAKQDPELAVHRVGESGGTPSGLNSSTESATHTHSGTTDGGTGAGTDYNPPYLALNYIIKI